MALPSADLPSSQRLAQVLKAMQAKIDSLEEAQNLPIAIVGIGCRFPGGIQNPDTFWSFLEQGKDSVTEVPPTRWSLAEWFDPDPDAPGKMYSRWGSFLDSVNMFDPGFFGISPREAATLDPQQRLLLETSWEALEHAGISPDSLRSSPVGVFLGISGNDYAQLNHANHDPTSLDAYTGTGALHSVTVGRLSYFYDFTGPNFPVDTACSSSLVAIHLACQSLRQGESHLALAGGVNLALSPLPTVFFCKMRALSPVGRCKTFDASADGYVRGEGCAIVVLKRLRDAITDEDNILAVIRGSAINHDGKSNGLTTPNGSAQEAVLRLALKASRVNPEDITYVEAHGTGTSLGDPIEVHALASVYGQSRPNSSPLLLGSIKTNIGHLESAAGVAGLLKAIHVVRSRRIPPHLHFKVPNPFIPWKDLPVEVPHLGLHLPSQRSPLAGVSAFGFSGTNAHLIIESPPARLFSSRPSRTYHLLTLSARTEFSLRQKELALRQLISKQSPSSLPDLALTSNVGRAHFPHRLALVGISPTDLLPLLHVPSSLSPPSQSPARLAFLLSDFLACSYNRSQSPLFREPIFADNYTQCHQLISSFLNSPDITLPDSPDSFASTHCRSFALQYSLARLLIAWGLEPYVLIGEGLHLITSACISGIFSLEDALRLVIARARILQSLSHELNSVLVFANHATVLRLISSNVDDLQLFPSGYPDCTLISGSPDLVALTLERAHLAALRSEPLTELYSTDPSFISSFSARFSLFLQDISFSQPRYALASTASSGVIPTRQLLDAEFWSRQVASLSNLSDPLSPFSRTGTFHFLSLSPDSTQLNLLKSLRQDSHCILLPTQESFFETERALFDSLATLYTCGFQINWHTFHRHHQGQRIPLPTYPFERSHHWFPLSPFPTQPQSFLQKDASSTHSVSTYLISLNLASFPFLEHHVLHSSRIVPAALFLEFACSVHSDSSETSPLVFLNFTISESLVLDSAAPVSLRLVLSYQPDHPRLSFFASHSSSPLGSAEFSSSSTFLPSPQPLDLHSIFARCHRRILSGDFYARAQSLGLKLGPPFQLIQELHVGPFEALARIVSSDRTSVSFFSTPQLDACLQTVVASLFAHTQTIDSLFLFSSVQQIVIHSHFPSSVWSHVTAHPDLPPSTLVADLAIYSEAGDLVAQLLQVKFTRLSRSLASDVSPAHLFYSVNWHPSLHLFQSLSPTYLANPSSLFTSLSVAALRLRDASTLSTYSLLHQSIEKLSTAYCYQALSVLGLPQSPGTILDLSSLRTALGISPSFYRLFDRLLQVLSEDGYLARHDSTLTLLNPLPADTSSFANHSFNNSSSEVQSELRLLHRCGSSLSAVLRGEIDPLSLLLPDGDSSDLEHIYQDSPLLQMFNQVLSRVVADLISNRPPGRTLHILEIGAGTGATSHYVLPNLPSGQTHYLFSDLSSVFLKQGAIKFAAYPFVSYALLDIEQPSANPAIPLESWDLIIAANVLHATTDLQQSLRNILSLLAPGGQLLLLEATHPQRSLDLIFGLTEGWWRFQDSDLRPNYPLLDRSTWLNLLADVGFSDPSAFPAPNAESPLHLYSLFLAQKPHFPAPQLPKNNWLLFANSGDISAHLPSQFLSLGGQVISVFPANRFSQPSPTSFELDPTSSADFLSLFHQLTSDSLLSVRGVIYCWGLPPCSDNALLSAFILLVQSLVHLGLQNPPRIWLVTSGAQAVSFTDPVDPTQAPLWGLGRVLAQEHAELFGGLIDLDPNASSAESSSTILAQIHAPDRESQVAFRSQSRWVPRLERATFSTSSPFQLDPAATYLITGGLGGIGLELARWLISLGATALVLLGRSRPTSSAQSVLDELSPSCQITCYQVDVADELQLHDILHCIRSTHPPLRGVFHAAGIFEDSILLNQSSDAFSRVLAPKIQGSWNLHSLTLSDQLDFFVLFSSVACILGPTGLAAYSAGNAYLGSLAHYRRRLHLPALCVHWGPWSRVGMAEAVGSLRESKWESQGVVPFSPTTGLSALQYLLTTDAIDPLVTSVDWSQYFSVSSSHDIPPLFLPLHRELQSTSAESSSASSPGLLVDQLLNVSPTERSALISSQLRGHLARALSLPETDIPSDQNLLDLGLDSLMIMEVLKGLKNQLQLTLYPREFYDRPALNAFSEYLADEVARAHQPGLLSPSESAPSLAPSALSLESPLPVQTPFPSTRRNPSAIFLLSSPRSGSTLLRVMLQGHPALFSPPELHLLGYQSMREREESLGKSYMNEGLERSLMELQGLDPAQAKTIVHDLLESNASIQDVYSFLQQAASPRTLVDKTPTYASQLATLVRAEHYFENPRYIFLTRHPYSVIESFVRMRMNKLMDVDQLDPQVVAEQVWASTNGNVLRFASEIDPERCFHLRYEDLVRDPQTAMHSLCAFLGIQFDPALLNPYEGNRMTDGVHAQSLGLNDPNFLQHDQIDPALGEVWRSIRLPRLLSSETQRIARRLGYELPAEVPPPVIPVDSLQFVRDLSLSLCEWTVPTCSASVFCVHGILEQSLSWSPLASHLVANGLSTCAPDLRGHGRSAHNPPSGTYSILDFVSDLDVLSSQLSQGPTTLVGHSMGAVLASLLASARPARFTSLILIEMPLLQDTAHDSLSQLISVQLDHLGSTPSHPQFETIQVAANRLRLVTPSLSPELAYQLAERILVPCPAGFTWGWDARLQTRAGLTSLGLSATQFLTLLSQLPIPIYFVYGNRSDVLKPNQREMISRLVPSATWFSLDGGHQLPFDAPAELAQIVLQASRSSS